MKHVTGPEMCRALERQGWVRVRIRGSHHVYDRAGALRTVPIPVHGNRTLKTGTQKRIMAQAGLTETDL